MVVDGMLGFIVIWKLWKWRWWTALLFMAPLILIDTTFFTANLLKLLEGAWVPVLFGIGMVIMIMTWRRGTRILMEKTRRTEVPLMELIKNLEKKPPYIVKGTAIFLTANPDYAPTALLHNLKHNKVLHQQNMVLSIATADTPRVTPEDRVVIEGVSPHFSVLKLKFGYMETPNVPKALAVAKKLGWQFDIMSTSFFLSRRSLKPAIHSGMPRWQDRLFIGLAQAANDATTYFQIPSERVVEIGTQVTV
jgi:KUP system potassium uptake protein